MLGPFAGDSAIAFRCLFSVVTTHPPSSGQSKAAISLPA
jgi:hypothetical protein